ncbi:MAG TPA: hypothetical protein VFM79_05785 [Pelobium sp.]|nr:hypothetical protein [Pelobium sp.]
MRKVTMLLLLFVFFAKLNFAQTCGVAGKVIALTNQNAVDNFAKKYAGCDHILGTLYITGSVTNLKGLSDIKKIDGKFTIFKSTLTNLAGLENLESVGDALSIGSNESLKNFDALKSVKKVGGFLLINANPVLENIEGLKAIKNIGGYLQVTNNAKLVDLKGLNAVQGIGKYIHIVNNTLLENLMSSNTLKSINGQIQIRSNPALKSLVGFNNLEEKTIKNLILRDNASLAFCNSEVICKYLAIASNKSIITNNAPNCNSREMVVSLCATK